MLCTLSHWLCWSCDKTITLSYTNAFTLRIAETVLSQRIDSKLNGWCLSFVHSRPYCLAIDCMKRGCNIFARHISQRLWRYGKCMIKMFACDHNGFIQWIMFFFHHTTLWILSCANLDAIVFVCPDVYLQPAFWNVSMTQLFRTFHAQSSSVTRLNDDNLNEMVTTTRISHIEGVVWATSIPKVWSSDKPPPP